MTQTPTLEDYRWLVGNAASRWLELADDESRPLHQRASALRRELSPERTHLVLEQAELRRRGVEKFGSAAQLFFTRRGLEQATDQAVASYKASRMPAAAPIADLCCGIGGDLISLANRGPTSGVELDPIVATLAAANLCCRVAETKNSQPVADEAGRSKVVAADAGETAVAEFAAWHIDPDRRPDGRRTVSVDWQQPHRPILDKLLKANANAAVKLAPAAELPDDWRNSAEQEWISRAGQCRQLVAWFGSLAARPGARRATLLKSDGTPLRTVEGNERVERPAVVDSVARFVFEPDPAVLAAGLVDDLAAEHSLASLGVDAAYLTGDTYPNDPALAAFEVIEVLPYQVRRLKNLLRARRMGRLEVKKRGVPQEPDQVRRLLKVPGAEQGTLLLARVGGSVTAILASRVRGK